MFGAQQVEVEMAKLCGTTVQSDSKGHKTHSPSFLVIHLTALSYFDSIG